MGRAQRGLCKDQFILVETGQLLIVETSRSVLQLTFVFDLFDRAVPSFLQTVLASHATLVENISLPNMCIMQICIYIYIHNIHTLYLFNRILLMPQGFLALGAVSWTEQEAIVA